MADDKPKDDEYIFDVTVNVTTRLRVKKEVVDRIDDEWRSVFYTSLKTPADIVEHIVYNLLQGRSLSNMDGFADFDHKDAVLDDTDYDFEEVARVILAKGDEK